MNARSSLAGALIATLGLMFYVYSNPSVASNSGPRARQESQPAQVFAYSQLTIDSDQYTFDDGGLERPRSRNLSSLLRVLGSNERATYVNLLNAIGAQGWELVESDDSGNLVTFKRRTN